MSRSYDRDDPENYTLMTGPKGKNVSEIKVKDDRGSTWVFLRCDWLDGSDTTSSLELDLNVCVCQKSSEASVSFVEHSLMRHGARHPHIQATWEKVWEELTEEIGYDPRDDPPRTTQPPLLLSTHPTREALKERVAHRMVLQLSIEMTQAQWRFMSSKIQYLLNSSSDVDRKDILDPDPHDIELHHVLTKYTGTTGPTWSPAPARKLSSRTRQCEA